MSVVGLRRSDGCADALAEQTLSWRLSLTSGLLDGCRDICTRADMNVSISFVLSSIIVANVCRRTVPDPDTGRNTRAHQTLFQPQVFSHGGHVMRESYAGLERRARSAAARHTCDDDEA